MVCLLAFWSVGLLISQPQSCCCQMYVHSASCSILPEISGCVVLQFVAVCTNMDFMTRLSLASLKHTIDDAISTEAVRCKERRNGKDKKKRTGNFAHRNVC
jgi:hypothetical protein